MHASVLQNRPSTMVWKQDGQKSGIFFSVRQRRFQVCSRIPPHTRLHKASASFPRSFSYCCVYEKFTQKWSHRLFWARLWPRNDLKSQFLSLLFLVFVFSFDRIHRHDRKCASLCCTISQLCSTDKIASKLDFCISSCRQKGSETPLQL